MVMARSNVVRGADDFFENQFLMRRVKENRNNIRVARYSLKDLKLEGDS